MLVVGLTGGIASGKSTVSHFLRELGVEIIDADVIAKELVVPQSPAWCELVQHFGEEILDEEGFLLRQKLGEIIFHSPVERKILNDLLHPRIKQRVAEQIMLLGRKKNLPLLVVDAPLLLEAGMAEMVDEVWVVAIPLELQMKRLRERDNLSRAEAEERIEAQMPLQEKIKYADRIIDNSGTLMETQKRLEVLWQEINS